MTPGSEGPAWPPSARERIHPRRDRSPTFPVRGPASTTEAWRRLRKVWPPSVRSAEFLPEPWRSRFLHSRARLEETTGVEPFPADPEVEGAALLGLRLRLPAEIRSPRDESSRRLVDLWVCSGGLPLAVEAAGYALAGDGACGESLRKFWGDRRAGLSRWGPGGFDRLRHHLAVASESAYGEALGVAENLWRHFGPERRAWLCYLFPERLAWLDEALDASDRHPARDSLLLFSASTPQQLSVLVAEGWRRRSWGTGEKVDVLPTLAHALGEAAAPIFAGWLGLALDGFPETRGGVDREIVQDLASVLSRIPHSDVGPALWRGAHDAGVADELRRWLDLFPDIGLPSLASAGLRRMGSYEVGVVRGVVRRHPETFARLDPGVRARLGTMLGDRPPEAPESEIPEPLRASDPERPESAGSDPEIAIDVDALPPLRLLGGPALPKPAILRLLTLAAGLSRRLDEVRSACDESSLDHFAVAVLDAWALAATRDSDPETADRTMRVIVELGGSGVARRLEALIRRWPQAGARHLALLGLEGLGRMKAPMAPVWLQRLALTAGPGLRRAAKEALARAASSRGWSPGQWQDRTVPDLDAQLSADDLGTVMSTQALRLERAMCEGRRWTVEEFEEAIAGHRRLAPWVESLLWAFVAEDGSTHCFRRRADGASVGLGGDPVAQPDSTGPGVVSIRLVHPADLGAGALAAWRREFQADDPPPFEQLERSVFRLRSSEIGATEWMRFCDRRIVVARLLRVEGSAWRRHEVLDGGLLRSVRRDLDGFGDRTVVLELASGVAIDGVGSPQRSAVVRRVVLVSSAPPPAPLAIGELPARIHSEIVRELELALADELVPSADA